jgi:outer membrane receptor protein involved in Fe transport
MSFKRTKLRDAIYFALVVGATSALSTGAAFAQDQPAAAPATPAASTAPANVGTIVVTGTRIQSQTVTASSPVAEVNAEEFSYAGATRIDDLVNQYPQMNPVFDDLQNNPSLGYPTLDLRGLGPQRTLVLVDGNRLPPGASIFPDITIIPSFLVKRVDILTGGASAVYGSDAVAGVVNFILDTDFEGVKFGAGISAYRHDNRNSYMQGLEAARGFNAPNGDSGFEGVSKNIDMAIGGSFADGAGHAMAWLSWRQNDSLFQASRDYSACALNAAGTRCGGSATNAAGDFYIYQFNADYTSYTGTSASLNSDGSWNNHYGAPFNYAPLNYYQRPDTRYNFGVSVKYDVNEHFKPYMETMYSNRRSSTELAPSGAFFTKINIQCDNPLVGTLCSDLGFDSTSGVPLGVYVAKRNVEGGNRHTDQETSQFRVVAGAEGSINDNWSYNASFLYGHVSNSSVGINDFLTDRIAQALLGCPAGSFSGCVLYNVWQPGGVTAAAAHALQGTSTTITAADLTSFNAYVTGDTGWGFGSAKGDTVSLVFGTEWRHDTYDFTADTNSQEGNFAGSGGPALPLSGATTVKEIFGETSVPVYKGDGFVKSFGLEAGYRLSDYNLSGKAHTYKLGFSADMGTFRVRGGYNRAVRAPNTGELFSTQQIALFGGSDPCSGANPTFTQAQCANTGVSASQYGHIAANPAGQYNQFIGGNTNLGPEKADTYTFGFVITPIQDLTVTVDYYDIKLTDTIATIGASTILRFCGLTGNQFLCDKVHRNATFGDLWRGSDPATSGYVENLTDNFGEQHNRGIDLGASYNWDAFGGRMSAMIQGTYLLENQYNPLPGVNSAAIYDCAGEVNSACQSPTWRHIASLRYSKDRYSLNLRWRYYGQMDYVDQTTGAPLTQDKLLCDQSLGGGCLGNGGLSAANYFDLSASVNLGETTDLTFGVNNIADKEPPLVGVNEALNGNAPGGYDQLGRYFFANITFKY